MFVEITGHAVIFMLLFIYARILGTTKLRRVIIEMHALHIFKISHVANRPQYMLWLSYGKFL